MTGYVIRYRPGTDLARRYPEPTTATWPTRADAEEVMRHCANSGQMEVVKQ